MAIISPEITTQLLANGLLQQKLKGTAGEMDFRPVVKLHAAESDAIWLLTEIDPDDPDIAFGLSDLGMGYPEIGSVSLAELEAVGGPLGFKVSADPAFAVSKPLSAYAREARQLGRINA
jgi:hypothetical protein